jgi:outer membrane receptor protein involved in Fe transport
VPTPRSVFLASLFAACLPVARAEEPAPTPLAPIVVTATRLPQDPATLPLAVEVYSGETLRDGPASVLDDALRRSAAFSLFRRAGSLTANPTAQGVSLRGIGPSGASRALVLLDGVPVNDPFGGWVAWSKLPSASLDRVELVRGGGSAAWGGASLGGVVQLISASPLDAPAGGAVAATLGDFETRALDAAATLASDSGRDAFRMEAAAFATAGPLLVRDPGPVDIAADSEHERGQFTWARRIDETTTLTAVARAWREERGNGTPYQRNASDETFVSATLAGSSPGGPAWSFSVHAQEQDFQSTFGAINASRTVETPASDQYAVPSTAAGVSVQAVWGDPATLADGDASLTTLGLDARRVDGETREYFFHNAGAFTRERRAGGAQTTAGVFAIHARPLVDGVVLTGGARFDSTNRADGFRHETNRVTGARLLAETYADREDLAFSPSLGLAWRATPALTARAAAYSAYRTPTLNELYRPFRVGPVTTQANPELDPETLLGGEFGLEFAPPGARHALRATVFQNDLVDAVANVSLSPTLRERRNLDAVRVRGLELGGRWQPIPALRLDADYLLSDARVRSGGPGADALDGKRLAQVPPHTLSAGATWRAARALDLDLRIRSVSAQYEDDLNTLALAPSTRLDLAVHVSPAPRLRLTLAVENLLDAETQTGRTAGGVVSVAPPRLVRAEVVFAW